MFAFRKKDPYTCQKFTLFSLILQINLWILLSTCPDFINCAGEKNELNRPVAIPEGISHSPWRPFTDQGNSLAFNK
jgi:hypothetical protein